MIFAICLIKWRASEPYDKKNQLLPVVLQNHNHIHWVIDIAKYLNIFILRDERYADLRGELNKTTRNLIICCAISRSHVDGFVLFVVSY